MGEQVIDIYGEHPDSSLDLEYLRTLAREVLVKEGWTFNIAVIIVDDVELRRINRIFLGHDYNTDVIAFPADIEEAGEIYVSYDQAEAQASEYNESVQRALQRLIIHGILHLGGWEDDTEEKRRRMLEHGEGYLTGE